MQVQKFIFRGSQQSTFEIAHFQKDSSKILNSIT